jgi:hypothetical protein
VFGNNSLLMQDVRTCLNVGLQLSSGVLLVAVKTASHPFIAQHAVLFVPPALVPKDILTHIHAYQ